MTEPVASEPTETSADDAARALAAILAEDLPVLDPILDRWPVKDLRALQDALPWLDNRLRRAQHRRAGVIATRRGG